MGAWSWMILAPVTLLFALSSWRFLLGLTAPDSSDTGDIPVRVAPQTAVWAAMTIFTGLLFAICLV